MTLSAKEKYTAVIGLEIHAQLLLRSKIFSPEASVYGAMPNTCVSAITIAHPGTLPKINKQAVSHAIKMGLACGSTITKENIFARKNYFYPDLTKGYQITQDETPICQGGSITVTLPSGDEKNIELQRIHLEEDTGKSIHDMSEDTTLLDFNRAGGGLIEIVTKPGIRSSDEAYAFLNEVRRLVRYLDVCDGNMEEGSLRCDVNISVMPKGSLVFGQRVEVKNMNSIRNVQLAIEYEINRQITEIEDGRRVANETRSYDATKGITLNMRTKTTVNDYRYFPDPNLQPIIVSDEWLESVRSSMPLLPRECLKKFTQVYQLSAYDASVLTETKEIALFFEEVCSLIPHYKAIANWMIGPVKAYLNELNISIADFPIKPHALASLITLVEDGKVSFSMASQRLYPALIDSPNKIPLELAKELKILQEEDETEILRFVDEVIEEYPDKVKAYRGGKTGIAGMLMGEIMKKSNGKASPKLANQLLKKRLEE